MSDYPDLSGPREFWGHWTFKSSPGNLLRVTVAGPQVNKAPGWKVLLRNKRMLHCLPCPLFPGGSHDGPLVLCLDTSWGIVKEVHISRSVNSSVPVPNRQSVGIELTGLSTLVEELSRGHYRKTGFLWKGGGGGKGAAEAASQCSQSAC